jgi:hypothetical protein
MFYCDDCGSVFENKDDLTWDRKEKDYVCSNCFSSSVSEITDTEKESYDDEARGNMDLHEARDMGIL